VPITRWLFVHPVSLTQGRYRSNSKAHQIASHYRDSDGAVNSALRVENRFYLTRKAVGLAENKAIACWIDQSKYFSD
jgi:hypothetical protein